jgi:hypothetical protein
MSALRKGVRNWIADHLPAMVIVLLALWAPSIIFTVLVDLKIADGAGSGYPTLRDPSLLLGVLQITLMAAALPMLAFQRARGWQVLAGAWGVWLAHAAWTILGRLRLIGRSDLASRETLVTIVALGLAAIALFEVRNRFTRTVVYGAADHRFATRRPTAKQDVSPGESMPAA